MTPIDTSINEAFVSAILEAAREQLSNPSLDSVLPSLLQRAREFFPADAYAIWLFHHQDERCMLLRQQGLSDRYVAEFAPTREMLEEPIVVADLNSLPSLLEQRRKAYESEGIAALVTAPLRFTAGVYGTLVFYFRKRHQPSALEIQVIQTLSSLAGFAIETAQSHGTREKNTQRSNFLAEASAILASSLDYQTTLASIARIAVPRIADWCAIDVLDQDGSIDRVCLEHTDPEKVKVALEITRRFLPQSDRGTRRVMRTGTPEVYPEITDQMLEAGTAETEHFEMMKELGIKSAILMPLIAHGRTLGVISLVMAESGRHFDHSDAAFVAEIASRAAIAVDNARLYSALHENEERMRFSLQSANVGTWDWNVITGEVRWSENLEAVHGQPPESFGGTFDSFIRGVHPDDRGKVMQTIEQAMTSRGDYHIQYRHLRGEAEAGWMEGVGRVTFDSSGRPIRMMGVCMDVTQRKKAEEALRNAHDLLESRVQERTAELERVESDLRLLSGRLLRMQDEERRHIARELHDSSGQLLTALKMQLDVAMREARMSNAAKAIAECRDLVQQMSKELRTMSHLLHPPSLDELGLSSALQWYVEGFSERSQVSVQLEVAPNLGRLSREQETTIFRIVQESLTNIHRHSGSPTAQIRIVRDAEEVRLEVRDRGKGMPNDIWLNTGLVRPGVGVQGMRERIRQLGGEFQIESQGGGTAVIAVLPIPFASTSREELQIAHE